MYVFNEKKGETIYSIVSEASPDLLSLLSPDDLEDVVGVYLQMTEGCILFPSTCKRSTQLVEYVLWSPCLRRKVGVQVKSGHVELNRDKFEDFDGRVYLFAASGQYTGREDRDVVCLEPDFVRRSIVDHRDSLPPRIQRWIDVAAKMTIPASQR